MDLRSLEKHTFRVKKTKNNGPKYLQQDYSTVAAESTLGTVLQRIKLTSMSGHRTPVNADADASVAGPPELARQQQTGPLNLQVSQLHVNTDSRNNSSAEHVEMHF